MRQSGQNDPAIGLRAIFPFWLALYTSVLLLCAEQPIVSGFINRLPNEVLMLGAMGVCLSLSMTIESPIINLLSTSTALVRDRASFLLVRKFTVHWMLFLTALTILLAYTPIFDLVVIRVIRVPGDMALWVRPGLRIMTFWSAGIAWRRFLQGILIRYDQPKKVAWGTAIRLACIGVSLVVLSLWADWPGVITGAFALMLGVISEAVYATIITRPICKSLLDSEEKPSGGGSLSYVELFWFHLPLAGAAALWLLAQPLVTFNLTRLDMPTESLAAWPVIFQITLVARAAALALPEVVISLSKEKNSFIPIRRFTYSLAGAFVLIMFGFSFTFISDIYIFEVQDMMRSTGGLVKSTLPLFLFYPALCILIAWLRGLLTNASSTGDINAGMGINLALMALVLGIGVARGSQGLPTAALALNIAIVCEMSYLAWRAKGMLSIKRFLLGF